MKFKSTDFYGNTISYLSLQPYKEIISLIKVGIIGAVMIVAIVLQGGYGLLFDSFVVGAIWLATIIRET